MRCQSAREARDFSWSEIAAVKELPSAYVFTRVDRVSCILPKRAIATLREDRGLTELVRAHARDHGAGLAREMKIAIRPPNER